MVPTARHIIQLLQSARDWEGVGELLALYHATSGPERDAMICVLREAMTNPATSPAVVAELVDIASSLDIAQLAPDIRAIRSARHEELVERATQQYEAIREFRQLDPDELNERMSDSGRVLG